VSFFIYGAGGHGKVVFDAMRASNKICEGFVDERPVNKWMNLPVFNFSFLKAQENENNVMHIAIGSCASRAKICSELSGVDFFSVYHPSSIISPSAVIGIGSFLAAGSIIGPDVKVGMHSIINHHAVIDHDCVVGNFCHIAPLASLGGGVSIGQNVLIGAGAIVLPGIKIDDYSIVGAGAIVTENVQSRTTVVGNPARAIN